MNKILAWSMLLSLAILMGCLSVYQPKYLSDVGNSFLKGFVNHEFLAVIGIIVTITIGSAGSVHLELNKIQENSGSSMDRTRKSLKASVFSLIWIFLFAILVVILKPIFGTHEVHSALFNSSAILMLVFSITIIYDLTKVTFKIRPVSSIGGDSNTDRPTH